MKVLDLAFSTIPGSDWVQRRVAEGIVAILQNCWTGGYASNDILQAVATTNLRFIREGGAIPCIYANAAPWRSPATWYAESLRNAGTEYQYIKYVMVDIEIAENGNPIRPELVREFISLFRADGKIVCTYSADWYVGFWKLQLGDANAVWLGEPYVHARYDGIPDYTVSPPRHPLGPLRGKQYRGSHTIEGVAVDASVMDPSFFKEEDDMSKIYVGAGGGAVLESGLPPMGGPNVIEDFVAAGYTRVDVPEDVIEGMSTAWLLAQDYLINEMAKRVSVNLSEIPDEMLLAEVQRRISR